MTYCVADIDVLQCSPVSTDSPSARYEGLKLGITTLPAGFQKSPAHQPFRASTIYERDIEIPLRDGTVIRADVFRPEDSRDKVPALVSWSPYGKSGSGLFCLDIVPGRVGVPQSKLSGFESFEAPDPAEWTARGFAIVNVNSRGAFESQGDIRWFGTGEGRDGYDAIEHLATLPWCSGKIAMVGNSWLAIAQWFIAAERPPHLACIAPLEGCSDLYREVVCRGGVPFTPFTRFLAQYGIFGKSQQEDILGMLEKYPIMNEYWEDKRVRFEQISIPAYVLASYSSAIHTEPEYNHVFSDWPIPGTDYRTFYLAQDYSLLHSVPSNPATLSYQSNVPSLQMDSDSEELSFEYTFPTRNYVVGYSRAVLYMSRSEHDDMDVFVQLRKADSTSNVLQNINIPLKDLQMKTSEVESVNTNKYIGPTGILRASRRKVDLKLSKPHWPIHSHSQDEKVPPGEVVKLEIGIWPSGIVFEAGERLVFKVAGHQMTLAEFEPLRGGFKTGNKGRHVVHLGSEHPSHVFVPFVKI
ncbi:alpha/beta-hydrolase [Glonium stellatum]|uniref:Alpha/beta-hydrolase n=1 Tax=Glonium stellatum TaxID=574774 RepID=A0A8E2JM22_9PEZI|nr:alpha/beta-hydrolase [Glonium stellatum]